MISKQRREYNKSFFAKWYSKPANKKRKREQNAKWLLTESGLEYSRRRSLSYKKKLPSIQDRFWRRVKKAEGGSCWEWIGSRTPSGYGRLGEHYAHRLSFQLNNGIIPEGKCVCHSCDNPPCVNPQHLWVGSMRDNIMDRDKKGRGRKGRDVCIIKV